MTIQPPIPPVEPVYEEEEHILDQRHQWKRDKHGRINHYAYESDRHNGPICELCGFSDCELCEEEIWENTDCLRWQAMQRNIEKRIAYEKVLERYKAQMEYYHFLMKSE